MQSIGGSLNGPSRGSRTCRAKRHVERYEIDMSSDEWLHLQKMVQIVAAAVAEVTGAIRMYAASLGSPERNPHLHIHVCPCPRGTPFDQQQFVAMDPPDGRYLALSDEILNDIAVRITSRLTEGTQPTL